MNKEIIAKFIEEYSGSDLAKDLAGFLHKLEKIKDERLRLDREWRRITQEHAIVKQNWDRSERELQASCPHLGPNLFCGDPCGGHDSYYKCTFCGKELR